MFNNVEQCFKIFKNVGIKQNVEKYLYIVVQQVANASAVHGIRKGKAHLLVPWLFVYLIGIVRLAQNTRQSKQCGFSIYTFDNLKSKSMVWLVRAEKMVLSGLVTLLNAIEQYRIEHD